MNTKKSFIVELQEVKLKVFTAGESPRVLLYNGSVDSPETLKIIHTHFAFEVFFITNGRLKLVTEEGTEEFEKSILIIPSGLKHFSFPSDNGTFCLLFTVEGNTRNASRLRSTLTGNIQNLPIDESVCFYIQRFANKFSRMSSRDDYDAKRLLELIFSEIVSLLLGSEEEKGKGNRSFDEHISSIESYINGNIYNKISLNTLSEAVHLSTRQVSRIIKQKYGCGFTELVHEKRLAVAELMLRNSKMKVSEISLQIFGSETYLYALFKKKFGVSPERFRKEKAERI